MSRLLIERHNAVAVVMLNRPQSGNALSPDGITSGARGVSSRTRCR